MPLHSFKGRYGKPSTTLAVNEHAGVTKKLVTVSEALSRVGNPKVVTSGVTILGELERLWEAQALCACKIGKAPKSIMFDTKSKYFVGIPSGFKEKREVHGCYDLHCHGDHGGPVEDP
jgi:hypothetical protein